MLFRLITLSPSRRRFSQGLYRTRINDKVIYEDDFFFDSSTLLAFDSPLAAIFLLRLHRRMKRNHYRIYREPTTNKPRPSMRDRA